MFGLFLTKFFYFYETDYLLTYLLTLTLFLSINFYGFSQTMEYQFPIYENPIDRPTGNPDDPFDPTSPRCIGINISPMEMYNQIQSQTESDIKFNFNLGDGISHQVLLECAEIKSGNFAEIRETASGNYFYPSYGICEYFEGIIDNDSCQTIKIMSTKDYFSTSFVLDEMEYELNQQENSGSSNFYTTHTLCEVDWIPCFRGPTGPSAACDPCPDWYDDCSNNKPRYLELAVNFHSSCDNLEDKGDFMTDIAVVKRYLMDNFNIEMTLVFTVQDENSPTINLGNAESHLATEKNNWKKDVGEYGDINADLVIDYNCDSSGPNGLYLDVNGSSYSALCGVRAQNQTDVDCSIGVYASSDPTDDGIIYVRNIGPSVILHELGHLLGLNHNCSECNIMYSFHACPSLDCQDGTNICYTCEDRNRICNALNATDNAADENPPREVLNCFDLPVDNCLTDPPPINDEMQVTINGCDMISGCSKCDENGCLVCEGDEITLQYYQPDYIGDINWTLGADVEVISENIETHEITVILGEGKDKNISVNFDYNGVNVNYDIPIKIGGAEFSTNSVMMVGCNLDVSFPIPSGISVSNVRVEPIDETCNVVPTLVGGNGTYTGALNLTIERTENIDYCPSKVVYDVETECGTREESFDVFMIVPYCGFEPRLKPGINKLSFSPNPSNNVVSISLPLDASGHLVIFDTSGRVVFSKMYLNQNYFDLNTQSFSDGIYLVQYKTSTKSYFGKVSILH